MRVITYLMLLTSFLFVSCESNEEKRAEAIEIVEQKDTPTLLNDLYTGADGDIAALCRILDASPSSIDRIRKGESFATTIFEKKVKEVSIYYVQNGQSFSKLRAELDEEYGWYDSVLNVWKHHPWWFWIPNLILLALTIIAFIDGPNGDEGFICLIIYGLEIVFFILIYLCVYLPFSPSKEVKNDKYTDDINHTIERSF